MPDIVVGKNAQIKVDNEATFAAARNMATAEQINTGLEKVGTAVKVHGNSAETQYDCYRSFFAFDTSGVTAVPTSATLKLYGVTYAGADVIIIKVDADATGDSDTDFVLGDFSKTGSYDASTAYSAEITTWNVAADSDPAGARNEITLNATALADMNSLSEFKLALIEYDYDYSKATPTAGDTSFKNGIHYVDGIAAVRPTISYVAGSTGLPDLNQSTPGNLLSGDLTVINNFNNTSETFDRTAEQVPFILGIPGPLSLKQRAAAAITKLGKKKT
jgi:hypothetical protein